MPTNLSSQSPPRLTLAAYVPISGGVYELDGLKPGPIRLAEADEASWLDAAVAAVNQRIAKYAASEIRFNIMCLVKDRRQVLSEAAARARACAARIQACLAGEPEPAAVAIGADSAGGAASWAQEQEPLPSDPDTLAAALAEASEEAERAAEALAMEEDKRRRWAEENERRKTGVRRPAPHASLEAAAVAPLPPFTHPVAFLPAEPNGPLSTSPPAPCRLYPGHLQPAAGPGGRADAAAAGGPRGGGCQAKGSTGGQRRRGRR